MHSFWTGSLSFGLVNIPIRVVSATQSKNLDLDMLHAKDLSKIHYKKVCEQGHEVAARDIVKGYEHEKGEYVVITDEDFKKANVKKTAAMEIANFVRYEEIDPVYIEKPYYLEPGKGANKAYDLLRHALEESGKVAIVRYVFRNREDIGMIMARGNWLMLIQLRFGHEVRDYEFTGTATKHNKAEMTMAKHLIDSMTEEFDAAAFRDTYREELEALIAAKVRGETPKSHGKKPVPTKVIDLMKALKRSVAESEKTGSNAKRKTKTVAKRQHGHLKKAS